jgi:hypothetical protein
MDHSISTRVHQGQSVTSSSAVVTSVLPNGLHNSSQQRYLHGFCRCYWRVNDDSDGKNAVDEVCRYVVTLLREVSRDTQNEYRQGASTCRCIRWQSQSPRNGREHIAISRRGRAANRIRSPYRRSRNEYPESSSGNTDAARPRMVSCLTRLKGHRESVIPMSDFLTPGSSSIAVIMRLDGS